MAKIAEELPSIGLRGLVTWVKSEKMFSVGRSGIYIGGFDSQEDSLRGGEADEILVEETGSSSPDHYNYQMKSILKPQLLKTRGRMIHLTTLPPVPGHPFVDETIPAAKLANAFHSYTIYEDPLATPEIIADAIKDCGGVDTIEFKREYLNLETRDPRIIVVPSFDRKKHVRLFEAPTSTKWQPVIDMGGVRDKTVALLMTYDFLSDLDLVWEEKVFPSNTPTHVIVASLREWELEYQPEIRIADVPGQTSVDLNYVHGYETVAPQKSDWQSAINNLISRVGQDKVVIHPRCTFLALSLESGTLNKQRNDFNRSEALGHCDAIAALQYGVRCLDRTNPWGDRIGSRDNAFIWPKISEMGAVADGIAGRTFGGAKKFGSFK